MTDREVLQEEMTRLAEDGDVAGFLRCARASHASDVSDVLAELDAETQLKLVQSLPPAVVSEALAEMEEEEHPEELLAALHPEQAAGIVEALEDDDAVDLIAELPPERAQRILGILAHRADLERLMLYGEETAGGKMTTAVVSVRDDRTVSEAITDIRAQATDIEEFYQVYCVDDQRRLVGVLPLNRLVISRAERPVREIMEEPSAVAAPDMDQEDVAHLMARYNVASIAVVDVLGRLLGRVTFDDVIDVVEAEGTEDLLRFGGASPDEHLGSDWGEAVRSRLPWLYVNLLTALAAGAVVWLFQDTITQIVALAAWMPIVAGLGGNAGTQALAVTVRRISLDMVPAGKAAGLVAKEVAVGVFNGLAIGLAVGLLAVLIGQGWELGLVVLIALWGNLIVAAVGGSFVPLALERLGVDPAVASSVFVTALTDVCGFFLLLGVASATLLP